MYEKNILQNETDIEISNEENIIQAGEGDNEFLTEPQATQEPVTIIEYVKEKRPILTTPIEDYSVTEGILLLLFIVTLLTNIFRSNIKGV